MGRMVVPPRLNRRDPTPPVGFLGCGFLGCILTTPHWALRTHDGEGSHPAIRAGPVCAVSWKWVHVTGTWLWAVPAATIIHGTEPTSSRHRVLQVSWAAQPHGHAHPTHCRDPGSTHLPLLVGSGYWAAVLLNIKSPVEIPRGCRETPEKSGLLSSLIGWGAVRQTGLSVACGL